eukprot:TRINITY_DN12679_c0_g1_i2.p1 TRINITY_DN12679_c0_g1~~TRINITY_DN12679_c0_g1_i2.p1  ORF type:complete len:247 (+),score=72.14 TRINITY_DN12679_c0_g1_i2:68-808(+)
MAFWGCTLKPGQKEKVESSKGNILHLSQACLHDPKDGKNYIKAEVEGKTYAVACLEKGKSEHESFDLFFNPSQCAFSSSGKSEVHLTGYFEPDEGDDLEEEEEEEEEQEATSKKNAPAKKSDSPKQEGTEKTAPPAKEAADAPKVAESAKPQKKGEKRKGPESEPPAEKKAKVDTPKSDAPKTPSGDADQAEFTNALIAYLKKNGSQSTSDLGSNVKRPANCPKLKAILQKNTDKFDVKDGKVSLK